MCGLSNHSAQGCMSVQALGEVRDLGFIPPRGGTRTCTRASGLRDLLQMFHRAAAFSAQGSEHSAAAKSHPGASWGPGMRA